MKGPTERAVILIFFRDLLVARAAVGKHQQHIVGGGVPIHGDHVEGIHHIRTQRLLQKLFGNRRIRGHKAQHGTHIGMDHSASLRHAADGDRLSGKLDGNRHLLGMGVRGHDGLRRLTACIHRIGKRSCQRLHACRDPVHGKLHTDHARGSHQHGILRNSQSFRRSLCSLPAVFPPLFARTGVGDSGIYHHCMNRRGIFHNLPVPYHRSRLHHVAGEHARRPAGRAAEHHRHVLPVLIFDLRLDACRFKSLRCGYTACDVFHIHLVFPPPYGRPLFKGRKLQAFVRRQRRHFITH